MRSVNGEGGGVVAARTAKDDVPGAPAAEAVEPAEAAEATEAVEPAEAKTGAGRGPAPGTGSQLITSATAQSVAIAAKILEAC